MDIVRIDRENLAQEHICCAITDKKGEHCVASKKAWMEARFDDGLVFKKMDVRGKAFIEYIPAEKAWCPIEAGGYMHIDCFWVSGSLQGQGYAGRLLASCIEDARAQGKRGLTVVSSTKKMAFLSEPRFLKHKGFRVADTAAPYFELYYLPFDESDAAPLPRFKDCAKAGRIEEQGIVLYYTNQCPFNDKYAPLVLDWAKQRGQTATLRKIETTEQAQSAPAPTPTYAFFLNGQFLTNRILAENDFYKLLDEAAGK